MADLYCSFMMASIQFKMLTKISITGDLDSVAGDLSADLNLITGNSKASNAFLCLMFSRWSNSRLVSYKLLST